MPRPLLLIAIAMLAACDEPSSTDDFDGSIVPFNVTCGELDVTIGSGPALVFSHPVGDTYGLNAFYFWNANVSGDPDVFTFPDGSAVTDQVPREDWQIPATTWSAIRLGLDGLDPYQFTVDDPFVLGYLPYTPGASWQSKTGASNDGSCPGSNTQVGGFDTCVGKNQADPGGPRTLVMGNAYVLRMVMIIPLGTDGTTLLNRVQSCYQKVFVHE